MENQSQRFFFLISWFHFSHGRNKFVVGAAVGLAGAVLGNQQIQQVGTGIAVLGLATKVGAHKFPTANGGPSSVSQLFGWKCTMNPNQKEPDESKKDLPEKKINSQPYLNQQKCNKKSKKFMYLPMPLCLIYS